jgi:photosystem II stability/assembly factor-like uncharacterized protein
MKSLLIISLMILIYGSSSAQSGWFRINSVTTDDLESVFFTGENTGYAVGDNGTAIKTTNAGNSWFLMTVPTDKLLRSVFFCDANTGYIVSGDGYSFFIGDVYKTTNGGNTWNFQLLPKNVHFYSVFFINSNTGYVSGYQTILKTTNAGNTWESQTFTGLGLITSIYFTDANTGYASEFNNFKILKTTNGGNDWQINYTYTGLVGFFGINFNDVNTGIAVGGYRGYTGYAFISRTTDGGNNWTNYAFNNNDCFWSVRFISPGTGYIAGGKTSVSTIMKTTNSGLNWYTQATNANNFLYGIFFTNLNTGYAVGLNGTILKTTDGGGTLNGTDTGDYQIPSRFSLSQNYPNPFNPLTKISFDIPKQEFVSLKVFDLLGREINTLVNEVKTPGNYAVDFDGSNLPGGVYFYRIQSADFTNIKKLILLK